VSLLADPGLAVLLAHLALPATARVDQRVPKKLLLEQGLPTAADKKAVQEGIEELFWLAALKPGTVGVDSFKDEAREYLEIALLAMDLRATPSGRSWKKGPVPVDRLVELLHRTVPYPMLMLLHQGDKWAISVANKRLSLGDGGKVVVEGIQTTAFFSPTRAAAVEIAFMESLALAGLPQGNLQNLYHGWADRVTALQAASLVGSFQVPGDTTRSHLLRDRLEAYARVERDLISLKARVAKESQINKRVDLNLSIRRLEAELAALRQTT
jgi:hypothetical protein